VASTRARKSITAKTRAEDDRLREMLKHADIGKLKKLMAPLIERRESQVEKKPSKKRNER
jgi:hypothetical protein